MIDTRIAEIRERASAAQCLLNSLHRERLDYVTEYLPLINSNIDMQELLDRLATVTAERDALKKALEIARRGYIDCTSAERQADGKCLGYGRGENDDEPCEQCKDCPMNTAYETEPETKTIQEWAAQDGIKVYDPDGFDRTDPLLWEKKITKAEYAAGIMRCTVVPFPGASDGSEKGE